MDDRSSVISLLTGFGRNIKIKVLAKVRGASRNLETLITRFSTTNHTNNNDISLLDIEANNKYKVL